MNGYCSKSMKSQNELPNVENEKSKRKTLNGCCQMCIKTVKMTQKCEKPQGGTSMEAWSTKKNGVGENGEDEVAAPLPCRPNFRSHFTPCHSELQNCHYELQNYKNATLGLKC